MTVIDGLSKIGGYFALFGLLKVGLFMYNKKSFEGSLKKRFKEKLAESMSGQDFNDKLMDRPLEPDSIDDELVKEVMSYEMMMQLAIYHHKKLRIMA